jgi:hypothetical protein
VLVGTIPGTQGGGIDQKVDVFLSLLVE